MSHHQLRHLSCTVTLNMENMPTGEGWRGVAEALLNWQQASSSLFVYMNTEQHGRGNSGGSGVLGVWVQVSSVRAAVDTPLNFSGFKVLVHRTWMCL